MKADTTSAISDKSSHHEAILFVEDESSVRTVIARVLRFKGYNVIEACTDADAIRVCEQYPDPIHLAIMDMMTSEGNRSQLSQRLGLVRPDMKVLYISGHSKATLHLTGIPDAPFLQKPFTPARLMQKIRAVLDEAPVQS